MPRAFLKIVSGARQGLNVPLPANGEPLVIGRREGELLLEDPLVSGRHCQLLSRNGEWILQDQGSTNGTMVDGRLVRDVNLKPGNEITVGSTRMILFVSGDDPVLDPTRGDANRSQLEIAWLLDEELVEVQPGDNPGDVIGQDLRLPPGVNALVEVMAGLDLNKVYRFTRGNVSVGRKTGDIPLSDGEVSRKHSVIEVFGREMIFLRDLGSTNGTYHNGRRISVARIRSRDTVGIGKTVLKLVVTR